MTNVILGAEVDPGVVGSKLIQFLGSSLRKRIQNYKLKIRYPRALEGARVSEGPSSWSFISLTVNTPLARRIFAIFFLCAPKLVI
jgi:hypothetical protein